MNTALLVLATGERYHQYARQLMQSADEFFVPHDTVIFTENPSAFNIEGVIPVDYQYFGYPQASYRRYLAFTNSRDLLSEYDYLYYADADMLMVAPIGEEIFSGGITATEHPGYVGTNGTPETNPKSAAYCPKVRTYFCGGFNGGTSQSFLNMAVNIQYDILQDDMNGIQAEWVDESFLNKYLYDNPPAKILSPSYCYPENAGNHYKDIWARAGRTDITPKLVALEKGSR